jgi:hypothetical protein
LFKIGTEQFQADLEFYMEAASRFQDRLQVQLKTKSLTGHAMFSRDMALFIIAQQLYDELRMAMSCLKT